MHMLRRRRRHNVRIRITGTVRVAIDIDVARILLHDRPGRIHAAAQRWLAAFHIGRLHVHAVYMQPPLTNNDVLIQRLSRLINCCAGPLAWSAYRLESERITCKNIYNDGRQLPIARGSACWMWCVISLTQWTVLAIHQGARTEGGAEKLKREGEGTGEAPELSSCCCCRIYPLHTCMHALKKCRFHHGRALQSQRQPTPLKKKIHI